MSEELRQRFESRVTERISLFKKVGPFRTGLHFSESQMAAECSRVFSHLPDISEDTSFDFYAFIDPSDVRSWLSERGVPADLYKTTRTGNVLFSRQEVGLFWMDLERREAYYWLSDLSKYAPYRSKPFFRLFHWLFESAGWHWCHCAALGTSEGVVLMPGVNGAGKSTVSAAGLLGGLRYLADDCLFLDINHKSGLGIYASLLLSAESRQLLEGFDSLAALQPEYLSFKDKYCHFLVPSFADQLSVEAPVLGILVPELSKTRESRIVDISQEEVMNALVSTVQYTWLYGGDPSGALRSFYRLVQSMPVARLQVGTDLKPLPGIIQTFITQHPCV